MEKEQRKLLLVAVSVGVFLLVTITAAIVIMTPKANMEENAFASPYPAGKLQPVTEITPVQPASPTAPAQVTQETTVTAEAESAAVVAVDVNSGDQLTINIPKPTTAAVPDTPEAIPAPVSRPVAAVAPAKPAAEAKPAAAKSAAPAKPAASTTTKTSAPAKSSSKTNDFWVQTGAFSAQVRAEDAKELLASKGITSIIENRQIDGKTWYRVRIGPYTSEKEANYWLALVKTIDGFSESQVRQTVRQQ
jgi:DedD protein